MMHEKNLVKYLKTENFSVLIGRALIEYQSSQVDSNQNFNHYFDCRAIGSIDRNSGKIKFLKNKAF